MFYKAFSKCRSGGTTENLSRSNSIEVFSLSDLLLGHKILTGVFQADTRESQSAFGCILSHIATHGCAIKIHP